MALSALAAAIAGGIAAATILAAVSASASTQTSTRAPRERAMRRRSSGKLVQSGFTAENGTHRPLRTQSDDAPARIGASAAQNGHPHP